MKPLHNPRKLLRWLVLGWLLIGSARTMAQAGAGTAHEGEILIVGSQGMVELSPSNTTRWLLVQTNQALRTADRLRIGPYGHAELLESGRSVVTLGANTFVEILPPHGTGAEPGLHLIKGLMSFFHRDKPGRIRIITPGAVAGVEGTEFVIAVETLNNVETTRIFMIDGKVELSNALGPLLLTNGQQAVASPGVKPALEPAGFIVNNVLQWAFYYPAVLDVGELPLTLQEEAILGESLAAYRTGDLIAALARYPANRQPQSDAERVYNAALLLAVGRVDQTTNTLLNLSTQDPADRTYRLANALRTLIAAVKRQKLDTPAPSLQLSTEHLAASYYEQSLASGNESLKRALLHARAAATASSQFGFAWERVAELEFSFGHTGGALDALNKSLALSPDNAQALALKGFLLAAQDKTRLALDWFNRAIAADSGLGNAWLGRGLCKLRLTPTYFSLSPGTTGGPGENSRREPGDAVRVTSGLEDLLIAAALEPQRALLRSYLGKAYDQSGDFRRAEHELSLAKLLDENDPTPWLYSALLNREENRINDGVRDLEKSMALNDNRALVRSRLLLDEDRAVRSSSLANLYASAGMTEVSIREAARAVHFDYANYSGHLFLSESYDALRDPTRYNLRYETVWLNELLLANLLSPVGGTPLSQHISQQEFTRLFEHDRIGISTDTSYGSDGQYRELASQFGVLGKSAWSLDLDYLYKKGTGPNDELDRIEWRSTLKQQLTPDDSVLLNVEYEDWHSGDNYQRYDPNIALRHFSYDEHQSPVVTLGWHHEWSPQVHTLVLAGRLENEQQLSGRNVALPILLLYPGGPALKMDSFDLDYHATLEIYTAELNQLFQNDFHSFSLGGRVRTGEFKTRSRVFSRVFADPPAVTEANEDFFAGAAYGYYTIELPTRLRLTGGVSYQASMYPENFRSPPISRGHEWRAQVSPKAALVWAIAEPLSMRAMYARSLGGVSLEESYRLEPTQLAGFPQTFRTLISESLVGGVAAPDHEVTGAAWDLKLPARIYGGLQLERLTSEVRQTLGTVNFHQFDNSSTLGSVRQNFYYEEKVASAYVNKLLGDEWSMGAQYRYTLSMLQQRVPRVKKTFTAAATHDRVALDHLSLFLLFNHPSGFFSRAEALTYWQTWRNDTHTDRGYPIATVVNNAVVQANLLAGYRFPHQRGELSAGVLNLNDSGYRLFALTPYSELPRNRTFVARLRLNF